MRLSIAVARRDGRQLAVALAAIPVSRCSQLARSRRNWRDLLGAPRLDPAEQRTLGIAVVLLQRAAQRRRELVEVVHDALLLGLLALRELGLQ